MFGFRKEKKKPESFDPEKQKAVLRCSICTGEQVAGFKDRETGKFTEIMLIRDGKDLEAFQSAYGISRIEKEY